MGPRKIKSGARRARPSRSRARAALQIAVARLPAHFLLLRALSSASAFRFAPRFCFAFALLSLLRAGRALLLGPFAWWQQRLIRPDGVGSARDRADSAGYKDVPSAEPSRCGGLFGQEPEKHHAWVCFFCLLFFCTSTAPQERREQRSWPRSGAGQDARSQE